LDGENRSAMLKKAKINVPKINPNWTAEVKLPNAFNDNPKSFTKFSITPLLANHNDVQQN
jgi:hypothetical protein